MSGGFIFWLIVLPSFITGDEFASDSYKNSSSSSRKQDFSDLITVMSAEKVSRYLRKLAEEHLYLGKIQAALKEKPFYAQSEELITLRKITSTLTKKVNCLTKSLDSVIKEILESYKISPYDVQVFRKFKECCALDKTVLKYDTLYGISVNLSSTCEVVPPNLSPFAFHPRKEILEVFETNLRQHHSLHASQYFISMDGLQVIYPAYQSDSSNFSNCLRLENEKHSSIFIKSLLPFNKRIVILIDRGSAMSHSQIEAAKCVFRSIVGALTDQDEVAVLLIGAEITRSDHLQCSNSATFFRPTASVKEQLTNFVNGMKKSSEHTNHTAGFLEAFDLLIKYRSVDHTNPMILYISRGLFAQLTDGTSVMTAIAESNLKMSNKVQINTIALTDVSKAIMWETTFLRDVAAQNFQQYAQSFTPSLLRILKSRLKPPEGKIGDEDENPEIPGISSGDGDTMISINSSYAHCLTKKDVYDVLRPAAYQLDTTGEKISLTFDMQYPNFKVLSFGKPALHQDHVLGMVGIDIRVEQLLSPLIYYSTSDMSSYAFAYEAKTRRMLVHPKILSSSVDANIVENVFPFDRISSTKDFNGTERPLNSTLIYHWQKIQNTPFIIVIAAKADNMKLLFGKVARASSLLTNIMTYNRIDLSMNKDSKVCLQGQVPFNTERCGLYLSPECFEKSFERIKTSEDLRSAQGYWAYITDQTKLITNPGLKNERLRYQIAEWAQIISPWCRKHYTNFSNTSQFLRRYLAIPNGILITHPAFPIRQSYEPSKQQW
uniref:VWFA domain-containing protein n=1 Tax=Romanomermis culicivorax TaxID=13658 RepID=A0A915K0U1_ROMCU